MNNKSTLASLALIPVLGFVSVPVHAEESITVVSYGGSYARACVKGYHEAFEAETGIKVNLEEYNGTLAPIRTQVESGSVVWDVVDVERAPLVVGCDEGLFAEIDLDTIPPGDDGSPASEDFDEGMLHECGVGTLYYATVVAYNDDHIGETKPTTMADFFDLERFPGRRGMKRAPDGNLEFALLGDGVPADEVYEVLSTEEGIERAFNKLNQIKDEVIWWQAGAQPPQMLADGEVAMTTAWNGRIFNAQAYENQSFGIIWDGQLLDTGALSIVEGSPNYENALKFVQFGTSTRGMVGVSSYIAYSPVRKSGLAKVGKHAELDIEMMPHMPTTPEKLSNALINDWEFWSDHIDELQERFSSWLGQ